MYRFSQVPGGLQLRRFVVRGDGSETPLAGTLSALLSRPAEVRNLHVEQYDLQADRMLESGSRGTLPPPKLDALVRALVGARLVFLDGREVAMSEEEILPSTLVEDRGEDVVVTIRRDAAHHRGAQRWSGAGRRGAGPPRRARAVRRLAAEPAHRQDLRPRPTGRAGDPRAA